MCVPWDAWIGLGAREVRWRSLAREVAACKAMQDAVRESKKP
jgi:hypothetical protein